MARVLAALIAALVVCAALAGCGPAGSDPSGYAPRSGGDSPAVVTDDYTVRTIELPYRAFGMANRAGSTLFVNVDSGEGILDTVIAYDLNTGRTQVVVESDEEIVGISANDRWLMWEAGEKLFARSLSTGKTRVVSSARDLYAPALEEDNAAWIDLAAGQEHRVIIVDLATGKERVVAPITLPGLYNNFMEFYDGTLAWTDVVDDAGVYRLFDLSSGAVEDHVLRDIDHRFPGYARAARGRVYSLNFDDTEEWDWTRQRLGYFDLESEEFVEVPTKTFTNYFRVEDDWLAVVDGEQHLTLRRLHAPNDTTPLTPVGDTPVDWLESCDEGFIASSTTPGADSCTLMLIDVR